MANKKLTDLTELTTPADGDFLYIVDVSDTTESAQGTSKKIRKSNITPVISGKEDVINKQNSLAIDGTGTKYPTVDAVNAGLPVNYSKIVYVNATSPITATIFDTENPPVTNDNALKNDVANLYIGTDASTWVYNSSTYVTKSVTATSSNFYLAGTTTDAGNTKTGHISRTGNITTTGKLGVLGSSYFATDTDAKFYIGTSILNPSNSKFVTKGTLSASNHLASFLNNSGVEQVSILNDGTINSKSIVSDHISVLGNSASLTFSGTNAGIEGTSGKYFLNRASNWELIGLLKYATDGSVSYDARTLVDKGYTDAKITQTITNGVTDKSPSEDAVFDALANVKRTLVKSTTTGSLITGTISQTILYSQLIPANTFKNGDFFNIEIARIGKVGIVGTLRSTIRINTTNTLTGSIMIADNLGTTNNISIPIQRIFSIEGTNLVGFPSSQSASDIVNSSTAIASYAFNPAIDNYIFVCGTLSSASDSMFFSSLKISN